MRVVLFALLSAVTFACAPRPEITEAADANDPWAQARRGGG